MRSLSVLLVSGGVLTFAAGCSSDADGRRPGHSVGLGATCTDASECGGQTPLCNDAGQCVACTDDA